MLLHQQIADVKLINQNNGDLVAYIPPQQISGLKFEKVINGVSSLTVTMPFNQMIWDSFAIDRMAELSTINYNTNLLEKEETFFLTGREIYYEGNVQQIVFLGSSLTDLLTRRVVKPTDLDNSGAGGFTTRSGTAGDVLGQFADEQMINPDDVSRAINNLTYSKLDEGTIVGVRTRFSPLVKIFNDLRVRGNVSYRITRTNEEDMVLEVGVIGSDKTYDSNFPSSDWLLFSPNIGNAINPRFTEENKGTKNYVYVMGEGEGSNQSVLEISGDNISDSIYNRREFTKNSRKAEKVSSSAAEQQLTTGVKGLNEKQIRREYEFDIIENRLGFRYRVDWDLGDLVTFFWEGIKIDFEIKSTSLEMSSENIVRNITLELRGS